jgi:hypothetical protein
MTTPAATELPLLPPAAPAAPAPAAGPASRAARAAAMASLRDAASSSAVSTTLPLVFGLAELRRCRCGRCPQPRPLRILTALAHDLAAAGVVVAVVARSRDHLGS